jgi:hypothetical protein
MSLRFLVLHPETETNEGYRQNDKSRRNPQVGVFGAISYGDPMPQRTERKYESEQEARRRRRVKRRGIGPKFGCLNEMANQYGDEPPDHFSGSTSRRAPAR